MEEGIFTLLFKNRLSCILQLHCIWFPSSRIDFLAQRPLLLFIVAQNPSRFHSGSETFLKPAKLTTATWSNIWKIPKEWLSVKKFPFIRRKKTRLKVLKCIDARLIFRKIGQNWIKLDKWTKLDKINNIGQN